MSIYQTAVKRPITTILIFLGIAIFGLFSLTRLSIDLYPDIETNSIMVMTTYSGASAEDIETNVTRPLENMLNGVSDLKHITSQSKENISIITLTFEYGIDIDVATNDVRDKARPRHHAPRRSAEAYSVQVRHRRHPYPHPFRVGKGEHDGIV